VEVLASFEPGFRQFGAWWKQLFGASGGKGPFPATAELTQDLPSFGQGIQEGSGHLFETMVRFDPPEIRLEIGSDWKDLDRLNYLEGKNLDCVEEMAFQAAVSAHVDGGIPVIVMDCGELTERKVGELFFFLELCCGISTCLTGDNSAYNDGVGDYQQNLFRLLGKPENDQSKKNYL